MAQTSQCYTQPKKSRAAALRELAARNCQRNKITKTDKRKEVRR